MTFERADRIANIALSEIVQLSEQANVLRAAGQNVLSLGTGEPDFPTPPHVIEAAHQAAQNGETRYPPTAGTAALRAAIAETGTCDAKNVIVSTGAKQVIANAFTASLNPGDEVVVPAPYWTSYTDVIGMFGGTPVIVRPQAGQRFKITPEQLEAAITPRTKWLLLNTPSNPSGMIYTADELAALGEVLYRHPHVWLMADEIYQHIAYVPYVSVTDVLPQLSERMLVINGTSKAHSMTGWRIGWGMGPIELIRAMTTVQGQITSGACSVSQAAALAALTGPQDHLQVRRAAFNARRDMVLDRVNKIPGLYAECPDGAFYLFPSCAGLLGSKTPDGSTLRSDADFCAHVLAQTGLVIVPGRAFGLPGYFRLSYAYGDAELSDAMTRLAKAVDQLETAGMILAT